MGGMQVLQAAASYPDLVFSALPVATAARHTAQNIAFHEVGRQAIMADPDWRNGEYTRHAVTPDRGPAVARLAAHITYHPEPDRPRVAQGKSLFVIHDLVGTRLNKKKKKQ